MSQLSFAKHQLKQLFVYRMQTNNELQYTIRKYKILIVEIGVTLQSCESSKYLTMQFTFEY